MEASEIEASEMEALPIHLESLVEVPFAFVDTGLQMLVMY
jgi:hypothetical protein